MNEMVVIDDDGTQLTNVDAGVAMEAVSRAEIDVQIATAHRYPRTLKRVLEQAETLATMDEETAGSMIYAVPRDGKPIKGPSVRLAEVMASCWGNLRTATQIVSIDDKFVTARGMCIDLERNYAQAMEVKRRITNKRGIRFSDDMIQTTCGAASAIAYREAVFKVIPRAFAKKVYDKAYEVSMGNADTLAERRDKMIGHFQKMGVSKEKVFAAVGMGSVDEIDLEALATLKGLAQAIRDGETTVDTVFNSAAHSSGSAEETRRKVEERLNPVKKLVNESDEAAESVAGTHSANTKPDERKPDESQEGGSGLEGELNLTDDNVLVAKVRELAQAAGSPVTFGDTKKIINAYAKTKNRKSLEGLGADERADLVAGIEAGRFNWKLGVMAAE